MALTPEQTLCKYLNDYLFYKVWNGTEAEYRGNIIARCASVRETSVLNPTTGEVSKVNRLVSVSNYADIDGNRIQLPDEKSYYLYMIPQTAMRGLRIRTASWQRLGDFLNTNCLDLRVTTKDGLWLYRNQIFVCGHPTEKAYLLAVNTTMLRRIVGDDYDATKMYVSVYYDSDMGLEDDTVKSQYFYLSDETQKNAFLEAASAEDVTSVVLNGRFCQDLEAKQAYLGYYAEVITDPDKEFEYEIDLTDQDGCRFYKSDDGEYKYIIHTPKDLNTEKYLYTHNTVDFYLFPINGVNYNVHGIFVHRFNTANSIGQLTHQDYWITERLIQAYMGFMDTTDLKLRVVVRRHSKEQTLLEDSNYLTLLYELTDAQILDHMEGLGPDTLAFWRASNLEKSMYVTLMFKCILTDPITVDTLSKYIDAIGYYNVLAALCKRVNRGEILSATQEFAVNLPVGLGTATSLYSHLWLNKKRIAPGYFTVERNNRLLQADFVVSESIPIKAGDNITTEIFERHQARAERFIPTASNHFLKTGDAEIRIFVMHELAGEDFPLNPVSRDFTCDYSYEEFEPELVGEFGTDAEGNAGFIFNSTYYNNQFLVITKEGLFNISSTINIEDIRGKLCTTGPLTVDLTGFSETEDSTEAMPKYVTTQDVPLIWDGTPMVFINGRELAKDIDFSIKEYDTTIGRFVAKVIHIANVQYFNTYDLINSADSKYTVTGIETDNANKVYIHDCTQAELNLNGTYVPQSLTEVGSRRVWVDTDRKIKIAWYAAVTDREVPAYERNDRWAVEKWPKDQEFLARSTAYEEGAWIRYTETTLTNLNAILKCKVAGTTSADTLTIDTDTKLGDTIKDGTVTWEVIEPKKTYYIAYDTGGLRDPWDLEWIAGADATGSMTMTNYGCYSYNFNTLGCSYLLCDKGKISIDLTSAGAISELQHILNEDPTKYGEVFTPTTTTAIVEDRLKDVYLLNVITSDDTTKYVITGLTLQQKTEHSLEVEYTTDDCFSNGTDFMVENELTKRDIMLYYHDTLSMIHADGQPIKNITKDHYGYISTTDTDIRNGAFVYHRGMCPSWLITVLDKYGDKEEDITRLGNILKYLDDLDPHVYPEVIVTDRSHHITSVIINKVIDDSTTGILTLSYDADEKNMLNQIASSTDSTKNYLKLIEEDPAMLGSSGEVIVRHCGLEKLNATYTALTVFIRGYNKGRDRVWINYERNAQIRWYPADSDSEGLPGRWVIEDRVNNPNQYYYAVDDEGVNDPWNLVWLTGEQGEGNTPILSFGGLNLRFIDIDPSYAEVSYKDAEHRKCILQIMKGLLPEDATIDGGNQ